MTAELSETAGAARPVWEGYCADPFVLRTRTGYYMYGTSPLVSREGLIFQVLFSEDLRLWSEVGGALQPPDGGGGRSAYWAPEVAEADGVFWMYYSMGEEEAGHHVRVARAEQPEGPFVDVGVNLTSGEAFAIDPSPFRDDDGRWWLFTAVDRVDGPRPGTCIAVQRLLTMKEVAGEPRAILRANADWQRFERGRPMYGAILDWHTVEGPQVVRRPDGYWLFYSGGNWQTTSYGVGVAHAASIGGPWEHVADRATVIGADAGLPGAGHCSVVTDPTASQHLVFGAWNPDGRTRRPHLARLAWSAALGPHVPFPQ